MVRPRKISLRERLAINVRNERLGRQLTQEQLGLLSGVSQRYISRLESSKVSASLDTVEKLAAALNVDGHALIQIPRNERVN